MPVFKITSWNINSVRIRHHLITDFILKHHPDFLCLQEIKCQEAEFPKTFFKTFGYPHQHILGQKGLHGVAILSKHPFKIMPNPGLCPEQEARHIHIQTEFFELYNFYIPAGGDIPDSKTNKKFAHKLSFIQNMTAYFKNKAKQDLVILGDFNIAPHHNDVWSHKQLLNVVSHTPIEIDSLNGLQSSGEFIDLARHIFPEDQKLYSWWSYRARDWKKSNRGRRLDHIWLTKAFMDKIPNLKPKHFLMHEAYRGHERPSDHIPISLKLFV